MKVNYYSVVEVSMDFSPKVLTSFHNKQRAERHAKFLSENGKAYQVVPSVVEFFLPTIKPQPFCEYSQP